MLFDIFENVRIHDSGSDLSDTNWNMDVLKRSDSLYVCMYEKTLRQLIYERKLCIFCLRTRYNYDFEELFFFKENNLYVGIHKILSKSWKLCFI